MDALSEALARMVRRQEITDRRLADIERALNIARAQEPQPAPPPPPTELPPLPPIQEPPPPNELPSLEEPPLLPGGAGDSPAQGPPPQAEGRGLETQLGLNWINRIAAVTLALFVAFVFKYAVDSAWIGPAGRVGLGGLAGLAVLGIADRTWSRD